ncbi:MAG TPA: STAS domain-containing protein [Planctomycetota bacterium]|nr:STAS domain-containing protein [Planctomycetota bacterium]
MAEKKMKLATEARAGVVILHVSGSVDHVQYFLLEEAIQTQLDRKQLHLVVNLSEMTYICSAGINTLGHAASQYERVSGKACYVKPANPAQWQFLKTIGVDKIFPWADSVDAAVKEAAPPAA